jgi:hypothetical protein
VLLGAERSLTRANALKNVLLGGADLVAAIGFTLFGSVHWAAALPLGAGFLAGGSIGPSVARRLPATVLRGVIAVAACLLAGWLIIVAARG